MQNLQRSKYKSGYTVKFDPGENGEDKTFFISTNDFTKLHDSIEEQNVSDVKNHDYDARESCFSFDSIIKRTEFFKNPDKGASSYCILAITYFIWKSIVNIEKIEKD